MINNLSNLIKTREKILIPKYAVCSNFWNITREWKQNLSCICCCSGFKRFVTVHSDFFNFQKEKYRFPWNVFTFSQYQHRVCLFKGTFRSLVRKRWVLCIHLLLKLQSYNLESICNSISWNTTYGDRVSNRITTAMMRCWKWWKWDINKNLLTNCAPDLMLVPNHDWKSDAKISRHYVFKFGQTRFYGIKHNCRGHRNSNQGASGAF